MIDLFVSTIKDVRFLNLLAMIGVGVIVFNLIWLFVVSNKYRNKDVFYIRCANTFDRLTTGCFFVAFSCFMNGNIIIGCISIIFLVVFWRCDHNCIMIWHKLSKEQEENKNNN